jgi:hypothetical protein
MGVEATKAIRARQLDPAARIDRLIAKREESRQLVGARRGRIKAACVTVAGRSASATQLKRRSRRQKPERDQP